MSAPVVSSKIAGSSAASAVINRFPELRFVGDSEAEHFDAETVTLLEASDELVLEGRESIEAGRGIEIKSAAVVITTKQTRGRFHVRREQHETILDEDGLYLLAVCEPTPQREPIAMKLLSAADVDERLTAWIDEPSDRSVGQFTQPTWTRFFDREEVEGHV